MKQILLRVTDQEKEVFRSRAVALGLSLTAWIRATLRIDVGLSSETPTEEKTAATNPPAVEPEGFPEVE